MQNMHTIAIPTNSWVCRCDSRKWNWFSCFLSGFVHPFIPDKATGSNVESQEVVSMGPTSSLCLSNASVWDQSATFSHLGVNVDSKDHSIYIIWYIWSITPSCNMCHPLHLTEALHLKESIHLTLFALIRPVLDAFREQYQPWGYPPVNPVMFLQNQYPTFELATFDNFTVGLRKNTGLVSGVRHVFLFLSLCSYRAEPLKFNHHCATAAWGATQATRHVAVGSGHESSTGRPGADLVPIGRRSMGKPRSSDGEKFKAENHWTYLKIMKRADHTLGHLCLDFLMIS